jgi:hypothetical protein
MGVGEGTALLIAGAFPHWLPSAQAIWQARLPQRRARNLANLQRAQAQQQAAILRSNADKAMLDKRAMEVKASIEKRELQSRTTKIAQGKRLVAAADRGSRSTGQPSRMILDLEKSHDALGEATLGWEWKNRISRKLDEANVALSDARVTEQLGTATASATQSSAYAQASSQSWGGIFGGLSDVAGAGAKAYANWDADDKKFWGQP